MTMHEEDGLQLPPALRMAANSGRGKKQTKDDERNGLKSEAMAMRLRLAEMDDKAGSISPGRIRSGRPKKSLSTVDGDRTLPIRSLRSPTKSRSIDVSRPRTTRISRPTKSRSIDTLNTTEKSFGSSGKYSNAILQKKIKKVTKMLSESTPGSKEHRSLNKKLTDYRSQLKEQQQDSDDDACRSEPFNISEIEAKPMAEEQDNSLSEESDHDEPKVVHENPAYDEPEVVHEKPADDEPEVVNENAVEGKVEEKEEQDTYSLELLQKKMKKLEKMMRKSVPGSKEYKKLQKKRTEYENQIRGRGADNIVTEKRDCENRSQKAEHVDSASPDTELNPSGLSSERAQVEPATKPRPMNYYAKYGEDENSQKQAFLEEARQLKREAMEKKRKEEESRAPGDDESRSESSKDESESSEDDEVSKFEFADQTSQSRKQAYLEEARQLKREALEKKKKEEEMQLKENETAEMSDAETSSAKEVQENHSDEHKFDYDDAQQRKQAFLEEARQLKREAVERKNKQEALQLEENETAETSDTETSLANEEQENDSEERRFDYDDDQQRKQAFLEEARQLKREALEMKEEKDKELRVDPESNVQCSEEPELCTEMKGQSVKESEEDEQESQINDSASRDKKPLNFLAEIKSKACDEKTKEQSETHESDVFSAEAKKASFFSGMMSKRKSQRNEKLESGASECSESVVREKKPNFLAEMMSKAKGVKEEKSESDLTEPSDSSTEQRKPSFFDEIKSKAAMKNLAQEERQSDATQLSNPTRNRKRPSFLDEIKSKASGSKEDDIQNQRKPSSLDQIRSMSKEQTRDEQSNESSSPSHLSLPDKDHIPSSECNNHSEGAAVLYQQSDENGTANTESPITEGAEASASKQKSEASKEFLNRRTLPQPLSSNSKKILRELEANELRQQKLERSLTQNGISISEEIPYEVAKEKIAEITESMKALVEGGMDYSAEKEYFRLEEQLSKFTTALMLTDEYAEEVRRMEQEWEESIEADNIAAIQKLRSHMPVNIRHLTEEQLVTTTTPNGKILPKPIARKFKRTNILQLLRVDPDDIEMMHPSLLESMRTTSLTLTERRALHEHFKDVVARWVGKRADPSIEKKWQWYQTLRLKFKETLSSYSRGDQCTIKADAAIDYGEDYGYTKEAIYENSDRSESKKESSAHSSQAREKLSKVAKYSEADAIQEFHTRLRLEADETDIDKKLLRELYYSDKRTKSLEKQLTQAGLSLPKEDISYDVAKARIAELTEELNKVALSMGNTVDKKQLAKLEHTFGSLSQDLDKYTNALMLTKEWVEEQQEKERQWETAVSAANYEALQKVLRHMPVNIRNVSENSLATDLTPNGKVLPKAIGRKFKRTNILMILRTDPSVIESMHPSSLEAMRTTGLTLTERRAIHEHLKEVAPKWKAMTSDKMCERKWMWHASLQSKLKEMLKNPRNVDDYSDDYGYPDSPVYEQQTVAKSNLLSMEELERRRAEEDW